MYVRHVFAYVWRRCGECICRRKHESGKWPRGGSGRHRPHKSLIMPLCGNSQLLMAFALGEKGMERRLVLSNDCSGGLTLSGLKKSNSVGKHVFFRKVKHMH